VPEPTDYAHHEPFRMNQCITEAEAEAMSWLLAEQMRG